MKLRKFLKRVGGEVSPKDLKDGGFDFNKVVRIGLVSLGVFALALILIFIVWPLVGNRAKKSSQESVKEIPLTYTITNSSAADWKGVKAIVKGTQDLKAGKNVNVLAIYSTEEGTFGEATIGDIAAGQTKEFTLVAFSDPPDEINITIFFEDEAGKEVRSEVKRTLIFQ